MRVAILTNNENSFPKPMGRGLQRMFARLGVESELFPHAWGAMRQIAPPPAHAAVTRRILSAGVRPLRRFRQGRLLKALRGFDLVVVVGPLPAAFMRYFLNDEAFRRALPDTPIVLYEVAYLRTRGGWEQALRQGNPALGIPDGGHYGLERYDWYLCASVVSEFPLPAGPQPVSVIGLDFDDGTLYPDQGGSCQALLDFERPDHPAERAVQEAALRATGVPFVELRGSYPLDRIRAIYRRCGIYFVAHRESFGLPICEVQACGAMVFTPYAEWCPSHWIKDDLRVAGPGRLSSNFVVYNNDEKLLAEELRRVRESYDPARVRETFLREYPTYYRGDLDELRRFVDKVRAGAIHSRLHREHAKPA
jgi:hypothetical protein